MDAGMISTIASTAVSYIGNYLAQVGEERVKELGKSLFEFIRDKLSHRHEAVVVSDLQRNPEDVNARSALAAKVAELIKEDPSAGDRLSQMITGSHADHIYMNAGNDANMVGKVFGNVDLSRKR